MVGDKISLPIKAKLAPKGLSGNSLLESVIGKAAEWGEGAIGDIIGDTVADGIGGSIGGAIGGEVGSAIGAYAANALGDLASDALGLGGGSSGGYFQGPAKPLARTGGLVFPNTPNISTSHTSNWDDYDLPHTNYGYWAYKNSKVDAITVMAKFTVNTRNEADYLVGAAHYLRSITKMHFGEGDVYAGTPPPVMVFSALGNKMFNNVPVVVTNYSTNYEDTYDYVASTPTIDISSGFKDALKSLNADGITFVPTTSTITITMQPYYNPSAQQKEFTLTEFKRGGLLNKGYI